MKCVGGPFDGQDIDSAAGVVRVGDITTYEYVMTRPTDTNWRQKYDPDWWIRGKPELVPPDRVYEWHETGWLSPEVRAIRAALVEAAERIFG